MRRLGASADWSREFGSQTASGGDNLPTSTGALGGGFKYYFLFSTLFGEDSHFDQYFSKGLKPPTSAVFLPSTVTNMLLFFCFLSC